MRQIYLLSGLVVLASLVGCRGTSGCNSCSSCSSCGGSGLVSGTGLHAKHPCTVGVCDCAILPLGPYCCNTPGVVVPAAGIGVAPTATTVKPVEPLKEMPKAKSETPDK